MTVSVLLQGGLGNQLFQIAAGWAHAVDSKLNLLIIHPNGIASPSSHLILNDKEFSISEIELNSISKKLVNSCTRMSANGKKSFLVSKLAQWVISKGAKNIQSKISAISKIYINSGVGFDKDLAVNVQDSLMVGYFQTWRYATKGKFKEKIHLSVGSKSYFDLLEQIQNENPIVVHIRLGDYLSEKNFGIPGKQYYLDSIAELQELEPNANIWIFTNDVLHANLYLSEFKFDFKLIGNHDLTAAETLDLMRHGRSYVISNSTFSWWGAFLTKNESAKVIAPRPWFKNLSDPIDLYPEHWVTRKSNFASLENAEEV